jgi:hypothetical protein
MTAEVPLLFRVHAVQRMFERRISVKNLRQALLNGEVIEDYSAEMTAPGKLILGYQGVRPFHVVVSEGIGTQAAFVITAYIPSQEKWKRDSRRRRS